MWRLVVVTVLSALVLSPGVGIAAADREGRFAFTRAVPPPVEPPRAPGRPGELRIARVKERGDGALRVAIRVEGGLPLAVQPFTRLVDHVLADPRGWRRAGYTFRLVDDGPADIEIALASAPLTDSLCAPLQTLGLYSCAQGNRAVLNFERWQNGAAAYNSLGDYRIYMINHEVGHLLGRGHSYCPAAGARAPLMLQQTKGVAPCRPNPWPLPGE